MKKRIFRAVLCGALAAFAAAMLLMMAALNEYFTAQQHFELRERTALAAQGVEQMGTAYLRDFTPGEGRIVLLDPEDRSLYDSGSGEEAVFAEAARQAREKGSAVSSRPAGRLSRVRLCAQALSDGRVLCLQEPQAALGGLILSLGQPILVVGLLVTVLLLLLSSVLAERIVRPLTELDLDHLPGGEGPYVELRPLFNRMESQQTQLDLHADVLQRKLEEFRSVTDNMSEGLLLLNDQGFVLSINRAALAALGLDWDPTGWKLSGLENSAPLAALVESGLQGRRTESRVTLGGTEYQAATDPVTAEGRVTGLALRLTDVTERERNEQMRREFTANVSHELKTPLHTISGCAELMQGGLVPPRDMPRFAGQIYTETQRLIRLVEDIIRLSHMDEGAVDLQREPLELYGLARKVLDNLEPAAAAAEVRLELAGEPAAIVGVPQLAEGLIFNLCDNAIKYNRKNGLVRVTVEESGEGPRLIVEDTGIGIPEEHRERIFERFYRVDKSHSKEVGGTGLGLSIVKHAAKLHGAGLQLESRVGSGTKVTVQFPEARHFTRTLQKSGDEFDTPAL